MLNSTTCHLPRQMNRGQVNEATDKKGYNLPICQFLEQRLVVDVATLLPALPRPFQRGD